MSVVFLLKPLAPLTQLPAIKQQGLFALLTLTLLLLLNAQSSYAQDSSVAINTAESVIAESGVSESGVVEQSAEVASSAATTSPQSSPTQKNTQTAPVNTNTAAPIGSGRHLANVVLALMGIVGLIFAITWFLKRFSQGTFSPNAHIKIVAAMPLGTRERIVLVEAGGQQLLLGITSTNINTLHVFETPVVVDSNTDGQSDFGRKLMAILQQKSPLMPAQDSNKKNNSPS